MYDQDWGIYAANLSLALTIAKAWAPHLIKKRNQLSAALLIQIFQGLEDKNNCGKLLVSDIKIAVTKVAELSEKFAADLIKCCTC